MPGQSEMDDEFSKIVSSLQTDPKLPTWDTATRSNSVRRGVFVLLTLACVFGMVFATAVNSVVLGVVLFIGAVCFSYLAWTTKPVSAPLPRAKSSKAASTGHSSWYSRLEKRWSDRQERGL